MRPGLVSRLRSSVFAFPLAALAALGMLIISELSYEEAAHSFQILGERGQTRITIQTLWRNLNEAETGERGYLLTGDRAYLAPYTAALPSVQGALDSLERFYANDAGGAAVVAATAVTVKAKVLEMQRAVAAYENGGDWRGLMLSNVGKQKMDEAQQLTEKLLQLESARILVDRNGVLQTLMINRIGVAAMTAISLLALFMYLRQTAALDREQDRREKLEQEKRDRLEAEVVARTSQLRELAQHLQTIREDERSHLARELHDELGALLTAAKLDAARLKSRLGASSPEIHERLAHLNEQLNSGIALKRRIIEDLRPSSLSNLGLVAALEILLREFAARTDVLVNERLEPVDLTPRAELTVYRLVQEALTNIAKYAGAATVTVVLEPEGEAHVRVSVQDDGAGFDTAQPQLSTHGLIGMRYRVEADGGVMRLQSSVGEGTLIEATLPKWEPEAEAALTAPAGAALAAAGSA